VQTIARANFLLTQSLIEERQRPLPCPVPPCPEWGDLGYLTVHVRVAHPEPEP
jgi:hypothetical protein